jgi:hypothetical protein
MTREEQIEQEAKELGQKYFPDKYNIWARPNYEAQYVEYACKEIIEWADEHPDLYSVTRKSVEREREYLIRAACDWLRASTILAETTIERFKKAMEEQQ